MKHAVVVDRYTGKISTSDLVGRKGGATHTHGGPRRELHPILRVLGREEAVPRTHRVVQTRDVRVRHVTKRASVVVVPPHRAQVSGRVVRERCVGSTIQDPGGACGVGGDRDRGEDTVCIRVEIAEDGGGVESVDEEGDTAGAARVIEQVEKLHAAGISLCDARQ